MHNTASEMRYLYALPLYGQDHELLTQYASYKVNEHLSGIYSMDQEQSLACTSSRKKWWCA